MIIRFDKDHLDFKKDGEYDVTPDSVAIYLVRLKVAKEVTGLDGKPPVKKAAAKPKTHAKPKVKKEKAPAKAKQAKAPVETKELKTTVENK
ncbi:MAG: hypothetical protein J7577_00855 [Sphingobacteriaceae bacterium]|nr:hypothetical protein [Sphingobacteriaceae bacterium]